MDRVPAKLLPGVELEGGNEGLLERLPICILQRKDAVRPNALTGTTRFCSNLSIVNPLHVSGCYLLEQPLQLPTWLIAAPEGGLWEAGRPFQLFGEPPGP